ncbi:MAG: type II/IV secretion system protein [Campylobacteraceae bacterium]|nr:type II/IV secretion system protein [Campylobacteraceae bacterium]
MEKLEELIVGVLINQNIIPAEAKSDISEKISIGLTLGEVLVGDNYISETQLSIVLSELYKLKKITINDVTEKFFIDKDTFLTIFAKRFKMEYINLNEIDIDYRIAEKISLNQLKKFDALPIKEDDLNVYVAFKDPFDLNAQDRIQGLFSRKLLKVVMSDPDQIDKYLGKLVLSESIKGLVAEIRQELSGTGEDAVDSSTSSGILRLIETIVKQSISLRGSDIHVEPTETNCIVRTRIDGMLNEIFIFDKDIYPPLVSRLKLLSNMDIAERRRPQDGRFSLMVGEKEYDFRISTLPIVNGESIVMRILDKSKVLISLDKLGMHPENLRKFNSAMHSPYGIILVTGPTGSGKTTTLYAALNDIKNVTTKIITVEDPVEYQLNLIQQVHVNEKAGLTFASALRSILRQDPDIIMIGEIRDQETLRIAIQSALTGHLVFSTLHTNDAIGSIPRMIDMGIESYLISGSVIAIEAQRLIRKLCPKCKQPTTLPRTTIDKISKYLPESYQFYKAVGCDSCARSGYAGREMISEVLPISDKIQNLIAAEASKDEISEVAYEEGFIDMFHDAISRAALGVTSLEEVYRVARE